MTTVLLRLGPLSEAAVAGPGYRVDLCLDRPAGQPCATEHLPQAEAAAVAVATRGVLPGGSASKAELQQAGRALLGLLLRGAVADRWGELTRAGHPARLLLDVVPDELRALPWELVLGARGRYLFVGDQPVVLRAATPPAPTAPAQTALAQTRWSCRSACWS